jgi:hypothetical protein
MSDIIASNLVWNEKAEAWDAPVKIEMAIATNDLVLNVHADSTDVIFLAAYLIYKDAKGKTQELVPAAPIRGTKAAYNTGLTPAQNAAAPYAPLANTVDLTLAGAVGKPGTLVVTAKNNKGQHATAAIQFDGAAAPAATLVL